MSIRIAALAAAMLTGLVGCGPAPQTNGQQAGAGQPAAKRLRAAVVTDAGGIDDRSFNASAWAGLERAGRDLGMDVKFLESREQADYATNLSSLAEEGYQLVFAVGFLMEDALKEVAPNYPETKFAIVDGSAPEGEPNCVSLKFREEEGCLLAGYLASKMSRSKTIAFVGGMESPLITKFEVGYKAGARLADPATRVIVKYVGNWTDVAKGLEMSRAAIASGADIVFAAAGKGGLGALDAVNERGEGYYGIGVDSDQDSLHPGRILTSMMKGVDAAVYETAKALKDGNWKVGERVLGIKEDGVKLSPMKFTRKSVPDKVMKEIEELKERIREGSLVAPKTHAELASFR